MKAVQFLAVVLTALALVPAGAHLLELPNKVALAEADYFVVQNIYRGWSLLGAVLIAALIADLALAIAMRGQGAAFTFALLAFLCMAATLTIFFAFTVPANQATDNWTTVPGNWQALRRQWEFSHATGSVITFIALCAATLSALTAAAPSSRARP
jgi:hypothetical protein